jgi:calcium-dependent phosphoinositide phospholipase C
MRPFRHLLAIGGVALVAVACGGGSGGGGAGDGYRLDDVLRLNQVQVLGTHNSYHVEPTSELRDALELVDPELTDRVQYSHVALGQQLQRQGVRSVELDVFADPDGGHYATRTGLRLVGQDPVSQDPQLRKPGFKVMHTQDIDFESRCPTFVGCLEQVRTWSDDHRGHIPIVVLVEAVDAPLPDAGPVGPNFTVPVPIGAPELDALDAEVRGVFSAEQLITPDRVRGDRPTLEDAALQGGWPTLTAARGKIAFVLLGKRDLYVAGHPSLEGRAMFVASEPGHPDAAVVVRDDPVRAGAEIADLVRRGYLVRTRADADTVEARGNATARRDAAFRSGAQVVSTDYPVADKRLGPYLVRVPAGTPVRCDPVNAPPGCRPSDVERPSELR